MMFVLCLLAVLESSALTPASAHNVCDKPPDPSLMKKVLRPTAKVLLDCVADVLILHKVNTSFLNKVNHRLMVALPKGYAKLCNYQLVVFLLIYEYL
ncbi:hypothetical protein HPB52_020079 [Rhipicephalus sanguineus]|uniref:Secreted protein n=1 Tax=Rhipicephalus sanguineus TaxID=34632 RepID=A0A9D4PYK2_RHISA|nr:hypothetical protein HPB52_020079 [Rhipicephalus sanguineus]